MNLKYKKFDFNKNDITLFFLFLMYYFLFYLFVNNTYKYIIVTGNILIIYFLYRVVIVYFLKKKFTKITFNLNSIEIKGIFLKKIIKYENIENITVRKNYLGSRDIIINFDDTLNIYRYFCNYICDVSIRKNHKNSYIICDLKNFHKIEKIILKKIYKYKKINRNEVEILYIKYSLIEIQFSILGILFMNMCIISLIFPLLKIYLLIYLIFINIKIFKKKYNIKKYNSGIIKIHDNNRKSVYIFNNYNISESEIRIDYGLKINFNYYYLSSDILPIKYKRYTKYH